MDQSMMMEMPNMNMAGTTVAMPQTNAWTGVEFGLMFVMWAIMMVAMMAPATTPMLLNYARSVDSNSKHRA
ncbi:MAG: DUF2182 domain-containing protein [Caldilineaceae bacterium]